MLGADLRDLLGDRIPADHSRQALPDAELARVVAGRRRLRVLDLGCGDGRSVDLFRRLDPEVVWTGVDIDDSDEVRARRRADADFRTFDGETLPFEAGEFDLVWCKQVLEHVRRPEPLLAEAARVLRPGATLLGSTSQLEPFHSRSIANPTPYGLTVQLEEAGLGVVALRPGMDALTLICRRGLGGGRIFDRWWDRDSPLNRVISTYGRARSLPPRDVNAAKLVLCGQFTFEAVTAREG